MIECSADPECGTEDPCSEGYCPSGGGGYCQFELSPEGTLCDDRNACTTGDACHEGVCMGAGGCDDGDSCTTDACVAGDCVNTPVVEGTPCDDGDLCTHGDTCTTGGCDSCTLACKGTPYGDLCTDDEPCTQDLCRGDGSCYYPPLVCDDGNSCTVDVCSEAAGSCYHSPLSDGTPCGDACTTQGVCMKGDCMGAPACPRCTMCEEGSGECLPKPDCCLANEDCGTEELCRTPDGMCDGEGTCETRPPACPMLWDPYCGCDGETHMNACTALNAGVSLQASGECGADTCDDGNPCTEDSGTPPSCYYEVLVGQTCDDHDACTSEDACDEDGRCRGPTLTECPNIDPCHPFGYCHGETGECSYPLDPSICDDEDPCTIDVCTVDVDQPSCSYEPAPAGMPCDDWSLSDV